MVDSTSKDEATTTPRPTGDVSKLYDAVNENLVKTVDEHLLTHSMSGRV